jgi:hypothetical protein
VLEEVERITDFDLGDDIIDLSLIDANASLSGSQDFTFRGNTGIDGLGQVATTILSNGDVLITVNTSGDTTAEMMILLTNPIGTVTASDFIL